MKVSEVGEFGLLAQLQRLIAQRQPVPPASPATGGRTFQGLLQGIGDDCAVWQAGEAAQIATTDTLVQDVHFSLSTTSWRDLGWKSLAVNLSDIAAMGGIPSYALITLGLPRDTSVEGILELYEGMQDCACAFDTFLAGGDIVAAPVLLISVSAHGRAGGNMPYPNNVLLRSKAMPEDAIAVTGHLGSAAAGLRLLQAGAAPAALAFALEAHRRPLPRLEVGHLALEAGVRCGMDVSDGLMGDLQKICAASGVAAEVSAAQLPVRQEVRQAFPEDWPQLALTGGEDYELLLVAPAEVLIAVRERSNAPLAIIGRIMQGRPGQVTARDDQGRVLPIDRAGWDHLGGV